MVASSKPASQGFIGAESYPWILRTMIENAAESWKHFCSLPFGTKNDLNQHYRLKGHASKEVFHLTPDSCKKLISSFSGSRNDDVAAGFVRNMNNVLELAKNFVVKIANNLGKEFGLGQEVVASQNNLLLECMHHFGGELPGEEITGARVDKEGFTLFLYESTPGLQCLVLEPLGNTPPQWQEILVPGNLGIVIPGMQFQYRSGGTTKALCYRVVASEQTAKVGYYSITCFVPFMKTPVYDEKTYGPIHIHPPGFNYSMAHEQFSKLFGQPKL